MSDANQSAATKLDAIWEELRDLPIDWEEQIEQKKRAAALAYTLSLTPGQRLSRNEQARRVIARLEKIAERYGVRAAYWEILGPEPSRAQRIAARRRGQRGRRQ
jgi:hypothetical protein